VFRRLLKFCLILVVTPFVLVAVFLLSLYAIIRGPNSLNGLLRWLEAMNASCDKELEALKEKKAELEGREMLQQWAKERQSQ